MDGVAEKQSIGRSSQSQKASVNLSQKRIYAVGLVIVFGFEFLFRDFLLPQKASNVYIDIALVGEWLILFFLVLFWIPKVEKRNIASVGLGRFKLKYLWWGVLGFLAVLLASSLLGFVLSYFGFATLQSLQPLLKGYSFVTLFGLFLTGTILEEVFYRGYLIDRATILANRWVAAFLSWFLFTIVHLGFFGVGPTIETSVISAALVLLYMKTNSIWPCIVLHGINDALAFLIFPLIL